MRTNSAGYPAVYQMDMLEYMKYAIKVDGVVIGTVTISEEFGAPKFAYTGNGVEGETNVIKDAVRALWDAYRAANGGGELQ